MSVESQVRYCGEVLSWMAECFAQSTLKCGKDAPKAPTSLTGSKEDSTAETLPSHPEPEARKEEEPKPGHPGYGANKKFPYIDE